MADPADSDDAFDRVAATIAARRGADPSSSYVASLFAKGDDAILKKIGEEATETVMAAKDGDKLRLVAEVADLWFHCLVVLARHGLGPQEVRAEFVRREGVSGLVEKAARGAPEGIAGKIALETTVENCIFCKIVRGEIPAKKFYEDDLVVAFHDIRPVAPVHFMLIPKRHIGSLADATEGDAGVLGRMLSLTGRLAREQGATDGFRTIVNTGRVGRQEVMHVHLHVVGGPEPLGPMVSRAH